MSEMSTKIAIYQHFVTIKAERYPDPWKDICAIYG